MQRPKLNMLVYDNLHPGVQCEVVYIKCTTHILARRLSVIIVVPFSAPESAE